MSEKTVTVKGGWGLIGLSVLILTLTAVFVGVVMPLVIIIAALFGLVMLVLWAVQPIERALRRRRLREKVRKV